MPSTHEHLITIDPEILGGTPVFAGTRVPLSVLFDNLADGMTVDEIVDSYPTLSRELVEAVLADPEQVSRAKTCHAANGIVTLSGLPFNREVAEVQMRIVRGEISAQQAIDMKIAEIKAKQNPRGEAE